MSKTTTWITATLALLLAMPLAAQQSPQGAQSKRKLNIEAILGRAEQRLDRQRNTEACTDLEANARRADQFRAAAAKLPHPAEAQEDVEAVKRLRKEYAEILAGLIECADSTTDSKLEAKASREILGMVAMSIDYQNKRTVGMMKNLRELAAKYNQLAADYNRLLELEEKEWQYILLSREQGAALSRWQQLTEANRRLRESLTIRRDAELTCTTDSMAFSGGMATYWTRCR